MQRLCLSRGYNSKASPPFPCILGYCIINFFLIWLYYCVFLWKVLKGISTYSTFTTHMKQITITHKQIQTWLDVKCLSHRIISLLAMYRSLTPLLKLKKVKSTVFDIIVSTNGADLCFMALQPGSRMGGVNHPVLSHTLSVYLPQVSPGTHLELDWFWLNLQSHPQTE